MPWFPFWPCFSFLHSHQKNWLRNRNAQQTFTEEDVTTEIRLWSLIHRGLWSRFSLYWGPCSSYRVWPSLVPDTAWALAVYTPRHSVILGFTVFEGCVCLHTHIHASMPSYMCACPPAWAYVGWDQRSLLIVSSVTLVRRDLSLNLDLASYARLASQQEHTLCASSELHTTLSSFVRGFQDTEPGPHAFAASILTKRLSPRTVSQVWVIITSIPTCIALYSHLSLLFTYCCKAVSVLFQVHVVHWI